MNYHIKEIEKFITIDSSLGKHRRRTNLKRKIIFRAIQRSLLSLFFWAVTNILVYSQVTSLMFVLLNIMILIFAILTIRFTIYRCKRKMRKLYEDNQKGHKHANLINSSRAIAVSASLLAAPFFSSLIPGMVLEMAAIFILVLPLIYTATLSFYQLYLLKKYCPYMAKRLY